MGKRIWLLLLISLLVFTAIPGCENIQKQLQSFGLGPTKEIPVASPQSQPTTTPPATPGGLLSREQAIKILLNQVIKPDQVTSKIIAFIYPQPLKPGDTVAPAYTPDKAHRAAAEEWFFWIDDTPYARFAHPTRFAFVNRTTSEVTTTKERWWPVINGVNRFTDDAEYWNTENWAFSNVTPEKKTASAIPPYKVPVLLAVTHNPDSALVINGWHPGETDGRGDNGGEFNFDANSMYHTLTAAGFKTSYLGPAEDKNQDRTGRANLGTIEKYLEEKAKEMVPCETLMIYITAHGNSLDWNDDGTPDDGYVCVDDETLAGWRLKGWLEKFKRCVHIHVIIDACYSGAMIPELMGVTEQVLTAADDKSPAYFDLDANDVDPSDQGGEFTSGFANGLGETLVDADKFEEVKKEAAKNGKSFFQQLCSSAWRTALRNLDQSRAIHPRNWEMGTAQREAKCKPLPTPTPVTIIPTPTPGIEPTPTQIYIYIPIPKITFEYTFTPTPVTAPSPTPTPATAPTPTPTRTPVLAPPTPTPAPVPTPTPTPIVQTQDVLKVDFGARVSSARDATGCRSTVVISFAGRDLTGGSIPVTRVVLKVNGAVWHDSGSVSTVRYEYTVEKQTGCGQTLNIEVTATNKNGQIATATGSITTPVP